MQYRTDTNCISLTKDANVALTYHSNNKRYVLVRIKPENLESGKVFDAGRYVYGEIKKAIEKVKNKLPEDSKVISIIEKIQNANSIDAIIMALKDTSVPITSSIIGERQYLIEEEQLRMSKVLAELKYLEVEKLIGDIIPNVRNTNLLMMMGNAYTSAEYIHYGDISSEEILDCPIFFVEAFSLLEQARENGVQAESLIRIERKLLDFVKAGFKLDKNTNSLTNGNKRIEIRPEIVSFLTEEYSEKKKTENQLTIDKAFELTQGEYSYQETKLQLAAIQLLSEAMANKRAMVESLKKILPEEDVESVFADTICIQPEMVIKQNGNGYKISNTVNVLIAGLGYELTKEQTKTLLERINALSTEELIAISEQGMQREKIQELMIHTKEQRIQSHRSKTMDIQYMVESIIEGYDWKKRPLTKIEKDTLAKKIIYGIYDVEGLKKLYQVLGRMTFGKRNFKQGEIFAIMMNIAMDEKIGEISYKELLNKSENDISKILWQNVDILQTAISPIQIDLLMRRGKVINALKDELIEIGIERDFIKEKDVRNLYTAKQIVEGYDFGRELTKEEKRVIIQSILKNSMLNKNKRIYLFTLVQNLSEIGLNEQEIYGSIINLVINGSVLKESGYGYSDLLQSNTKIEELKDKKSNIQTKVSEVTIKKAILDNMSQEEINSLKNRLKDLGVSENIIESKREENLAMAEKILEGYEFERELNKEEKRAIIQSILKSAKLNKNESNYLIKLVQTLSKIGLDEQKIYGSIINMAINDSAVKDSGYNYTVMIGSPSKVEELKNKKTKIQTKVSEVTIKKAIVDNLNQEEINSLKIRLKDLGLSEEIIESKREENLAIVEKIVEGYEFERKLSKEEKKAIIQSILKAARLNKNESSYLITLVQTLREIGLNEQEIYGSIINMAINDSAVKDSGYSYTVMIGSSSKVEELKKKKSKIQTKVSEVTIKKAIIDNLNEEEINSLKIRLKDLGLSQKIIESKREENLAMAEKIVEGYEFERKLSKEEKKAIIQSILKAARLNKNERNYLITLVQTLSEIGLNEQEIYGSIINMAINDSAVKDSGYSYTVMIGSSSKVEELKKKKSKIQTKVSEVTIKKAIVDNLNEEEINSLKIRLKDLGLSEEIIESKREENLAMAEKIVEGYEFERKLSKEEKKAIIQSILKNSALNKNRKKYLATLVQNLSEIGLDEQEIYRSIINMAINGSVVKEKGYDYSSLLQSNARVEELRGRKSEISTIVSEETIKKAQEQSKKIMKKAVAKAKEKGNLSSIDSTRKALRELQELGNPIPVEQD